MEQSLGHSINFNSSLNNIGSGLLTSSANFNNINNNNNTNVNNHNNNNNISNNNNNNNTTSANNNLTQNNLLVNNNAINVSSGNSLNMSNSGQSNNGAGQYCLNTDILNKGIIINNYLSALNNSTAMTQSQILGAPNRSNLKQGGINPNIYFNPGPQGMAGGQNFQGLFNKNFDEAEKI